MSLKRLKGIESKVKAASTERASLQCSICGQTTGGCGKIAGNICRSPEVERPPCPGVLRSVQR